MSTNIIENNIININFFLLFFVTLFYWLQSALFLPKSLNSLPNKLTYLSCFLQVGFLVLRWFSSGHFPLSNLYESLLFLSWVLTTLLLFLNSKLITKNTSQTKNIKDRLTSFNFLKEQTFLFESLLGSILSPLILLLNTFATFSLPLELKTSTALVPALQSNWLLMHVTVMILSYATLLCGCLFSIIYLFLTPANLTEIEFQGNSIGLPTNQTLTSLNNSLEDKKLVNTNSSNLAKTLDNLSYRILGFGFPLLTIGILSGAVWANQTWGSYWSWDPKETWALITWLIFAIYLHTRISKGWSGRKSAYLASFGFIIIWICYLGVNLLGKGLHSYGFFN